MDIAHLVSGDHVDVAPETRVGRLVGAFEEPTIRDVIVPGDAFDGVITRRQLAVTHHQPNDELGSLARPASHANDHECSVAVLAPDVG